MNGELFDFSRYQFGIKKINSSTEPILCFNDTLGNGRKLNKPLIAFIIKSIKQSITQKQLNGGAESKKLSSKQTLIKSLKSIKPLSKKEAYDKRRRSR